MGEEETIGAKLDLDFWIQWFLEISSSSFITAVLSQMCCWSTEVDVFLETSGGLKLNSVIKEDI